MSQKLYDIANDLERVLRESDEYKALQAAFKNIDQNEESKKLFEEFKTMSLKFQELQMSGQQPSESDIKEAEELSVKAQKDEHISALIRAEQTLSMMMTDINRIITKPLEDIYNR